MHVLVPSAVVAALFLTAPARAAEGEAGPAGTPDWLDPILHATARVIESVGVAIIVVGALIATVIFLFRLARHRRMEEAYHTYRANLGRGILLGLEFLVAADIVGTVAVDPTLRNLAVLGVIVLIRTFLSFTLEIEIEGRLPWRQDHHRRQKKGQSTP